MQNRSSASVKVFSPRYSRDEMIRLLSQRLPGLHERLPLRYVVLFGSYAKGNFTAFSDIDLLVVYADPPRVEAFAMVKKTLNLLGLEPHVFSENEFEAVQSVWCRMIEGGVVLWGESPSLRKDGSTSSI